MVATKTALLLGLGLLGGLPSSQKKTKLVSSVKTVHETTKELKGVGEKIKTPPTQVPHTNNTSMDFFQNEHHCTIVKEIIDETITIMRKKKPQLFFKGTRDPKYLQVLYTLNNGKQMMT